MIIDVLLLLCLAAMAGFGLLMKYVLVPGAERWAIYGRNVDLSFLRLDRHDWGGIHYFMALVFGGLLVLHIVLHWRMIVGMTCRLIPNRVARRMAAVLLLILVAALTAFPFFVKPQVEDIPRGGGRRQSFDRD